VFDPLPSVLPHRTGGDFVTTNLRLSIRRLSGFGFFYLFEHHHLLDLHLTYIAKIDFLGSAAKGAFGDWIEKKIFLLIKFDRDHVNIEYLQAV
jgi:hypothetical protein